MSKTVNMGVELASCIAEEILKTTLPRIHFLVYSDSDLLIRGINEI